MAQHTIPITINSAASIQTNDWENLNDLVQAALTAASKGPITSFGQEVKIKHARGTAAFRLQITSDPQNTTPADELLVEETQPYSDSMQQCSLMDKWIRAVDATDTSVDGGLAVITVDQA